MEIRVLGPLELIHAGRSVSIAAAKERRLLAALIIAAGREASSDGLIDAVWAGSPPASSRKLLHVYVSKLRKVLAAGASIATGPGGYALLLEESVLDAAVFERLLAEGRAALRAGNPMLAASVLGRAVGLWRGGAYADVAYDDFARAEADRLEELRLVAIEERIDAELALGHHAEVLSDLRTLTEEYPLRERLHGQLMVVLYRTGRQSDALAHYHAFRDRLAEELGLDPGPELRALQERILQQDPSLVAVPGHDASRPAMPVPAAPLLGRERELSQLMGLIGRPDVRLVVLTGAGGSGKTRLALELARVAAPSFANGAVMVELAPIRDPSLVVGAIARALGVPEMPEREPLDALTEALGQQEVLIVVDNVEHVPEAAPAFVQIVARAPRVEIIATSRRVFHVSGEYVFPVPPLDEHAAVALFVERARALDPTFTLTDDNSGDIRAICVSVDGLPLAIELAAARTNTLSPRALRERLSRRLTVLTGGAHDLPARQQALRDTIAWSVELLTPDERAAFSRLAVFARSWTLEAAERVCSVDLDRLSALVDHNLVQKRGDDRFGMLDVVSEFAGEMLQSSGEADEMFRRHASFAVELAEDAESHLGGPDQAAWLAVLDAEHDEIRIAQERLSKLGDFVSELRLASAIGRYRYVRGYLAEGRSSLEDALEHGDGVAPALRAKACRVASAICVLEGHWERARALCEQALELYRSARDEQGVARSLSNLGAILIGMERHKKAAEALDEAVRMARKLRDDRILALSLNNRGDVALIHGDPRGAKEYFAESLAILRALGDETNVVRSVFNLGAALMEVGEHEGARALFLESLERSVPLDDREDAAWCLIALASLRAGDDAEAGAMLLGAAERLLDMMGAKMKPYERSLHERTVEALRGLLGEEAFARSRASGCDIRPEEAFALARKL